MLNKDNIPIFQQFGNTIMCLRLKKWKIRFHEALKQELKAKVKIMQQMRWVLLKKLEKKNRLRAQARGEGLNQVEESEAEAANIVVAKSQVEAGSKVHI